MLDNPYSMTSMIKGKAPGKAKQITKQQLKKFNKKMKALKVAKADGASKEEKKALRKKIRKELKEAGLQIHLAFAHPPSGACICKQPFHTYLATVEHVGG